MKHVIVKLLSLVIVSFLFTFCETSTTYTQFIAVPTNGWPSDTTFTFTPQIENVTDSFNVYVMVRHDKNYAYSNLWLKVIAKPLALSDTTGMVEIPIADKTGKWLGDCSQSMCTAKVLLQENLKLDEAAAFKAEVIQYMREENLQNIKDIGLSFEKVE